MKNVLTAVLFLFLSIVNPGAAHAQHCLNNDADTQALMDVPVLNAQGGQLLTSDNSPLHSAIDVKRFAPCLEKIPSAKDEVVFFRLKFVIVNQALSDGDMDYLVANLKSLYTGDIDVVQITAPLDEARNDDYWQQYDAGQLLEMDALFEGQKEKEYVIAIVPVDIYSLNTNYSLGMTQVDSMRSVLSTARLKEGAAKITGTRPLPDRLYKIMLRRLGQMSGLPSTCGPMNFAGSAAILDVTTNSYCPNDETFMRQRGVIR